MEVCSSCGAMPDDNSYASPSPDGSPAAGNRGLGPGSYAAPPPPPPLSHAMIDKQMPGPGHKVGKLHQGRVPAPGLNCCRPVLLCCLLQIKGLLCLHANKIAHRDIKPQNFLVISGRTVIIGDLGLCKVW